MSAIRGISKANRTQRHLVDRDGRSARLLDAAPDAVVVLNHYHEIMQLSVQAEDEFGYERGELVGQNIKSIIPVGFAEHFIARGLRSSGSALARQVGSEIELTGQRKDGTQFPIGIMLKPLDGDADVWAAVAIRDISLRKDAQMRLAQMENRYRALLEATPDAMV